MQMKQEKSHEVWVTIMMLHFLNTKKIQVHHKVQKGLEQAEPQNEWKAVKTETTKNFLLLFIFISIRCDLYKE